MTLENYLAPTSELEAVNEMLRSIGEAPVNTLENLQVIDASAALSTLRNVSREVQAEGWHFNSETDYPLVRNEHDEIVLPSNTLRVDTDGADWDIDVVQRGSRLYDRKNHRYTFEKDLAATLLVMLPFEELPEAARQFIFIRAARRFQDRTVGSQVLHQFQEGDEARARVLLEQTDADTADHNILSGNWAVARIINRRTPP